MHLFSFLCYRTVTLNSLLGLPVGMSDFALLYKKRLQNLQAPHREQIYKKEIIRMETITRSLSLALCCLLLSIQAKAQEVATKPSSPFNEFANPPATARPHVFWYWINGNISREGITADLESMARVGIGGAGIFNIGGHASTGPVKMMSPEWRELMKHAIREAKRVGVDINLNNSMTGWSSSGGPWITPELSMQRVTWSEVTVDHDKSTEAVVLPQPLSNLGYYRDIAVLAFPTPAAESAPEKPELTSNIKQFDRELVDTYSDVPRGRNWDTEPLPTVASLKLVVPEKESPFIQWAHATPVRMRSLQMTFSKGEILSGVLKASDDGVAWRDVQLFTSGQKGSVSSAFVGEPAKIWRIEFNPSPDIVLTGVRLWQGYRIADYTGKAMFDPYGLDSPKFTHEKLLTPELLFDCVIPRNGILDLTAKMSPDGRLDWRAPAGRWTILRFGHTPTGAQTGPSAGVTANECDKFNTVALDVHFANSLQPWFDDPELNAVIKYVHVDSYERGAQNWTAALPQEFQKRMSYDVLQWLPALTGRVIGDVRSSEKFLWDFRNVTCGLMHENYFGHMAKLCEKAGKLFTCEPYHMNQFNNITAGSHPHIPMCEVWMGPGAGTINPYWIKLGASPAHIYGRNIVLAEAFTAPANVGGNWSTDFFDMKDVGDVMFCGGVNRFMYHVYVHQPWLDVVPGMTLAIYGTHFERTNTWWEKMTAFNTYVSRCQNQLQRGIFVGDILYSCGENNPNQHVMTEGALAVPKGYDYDVCDPKAIHERIQVKDGQFVLPDGVSYRMLVLPDDPSMTLKMLRRLDVMVREGAVIVGCTKPSFSPTLADGPGQLDEFQKRADALWDNGKIISNKKVAEVMATLAPPDFEARGAKAHVRHIHRRDKGKDLYFVANLSTVAQRFDAIFRTQAKGSPVLMDAVTGEIRALPEYRTENGRTIVPMIFESKQSFFIVFGDEKVKPAGEKNFEQLVPLQGIAGPWTVRFDPKRGGPQQPVTFAELTDWTKHSEAGIKYYSGTALYHKVFDMSLVISNQSPVASTVHRPRITEHSLIYLSLGQVKNMADVRLNGKPLGIVWCAPWQIAVPPGLLKEKGNQLEIEVVNLWPNRMIGDEQLPSDATYSDGVWRLLKSLPDWFKNKQPRASGRVSFSNNRAWDKDSPLLPSGLLGPVTIQAADPTAERTKE